MTKPSKRKKIKRDDYDRVILTETIPFETPLIFSNEGLYDSIREIKELPIAFRNLLEALVHGTKKSPHTIPFHYRIRKDSLVDCNS